jgi:hypothetical protein
MLRGQHIIKIIDLKEKGYEDVCWIKLPQDLIQRRAIGNTVMNAGFYIEAGNFLADPVAVRSEARGLDRSNTRSPVLIPLRAWMFVLVFLCCVVLCR